MKVTVNRGHNNSLDLKGFSYILPKLVKRSTRVNTLKDRMLRLFLQSFLVCLILVAIAFAQINPDIQQAIDSGNTAKAIELLQAEIASDPSYHINYYLLGKIYFDEARYRKAADYFQQALDKKNSHYESMYLLSRSLIKLNELDRAEKLIKEGLKKAKDMKPQFENAAGLLAVAQGDYQEADRAFRRALAQSDAEESKELKDLENAPISEPDRKRLMDSARTSYAKEQAEYHIHLGDANFYQGVYPLAIVEYEKALEIDTGSVEVHYHWAEACLEMKDYNCAIEKLKLVLQKDSTHAAAWMRAGGIYFKAARSTRERQARIERYKEAIGSYNKYLELSGVQPDSESVRVFFELGMAYTALSGYEEAKDYFEKVLAIPYVPKDIYYYYGKTLWATRDYKKGAEMIQKHLDWVKQQGDDYKSSVSDAELYQVLGDCYFYSEDKDYANAIKYYRKSLDAYPENERLLYNMAFAYHQLNSYEQAMEYYQKRIALGIDSSSASIYKNAGFCALNIANTQGDNDEGDLIEDEDDLTGTPASGANADVNYYELAIEYLTKFLEYSPDDANSVRLVAQTYLFNLSDCANGVAYYEKLLALEPSNCDAMRSIGYAYFGGVCNKNYDKALTFLKEAYNCVSNKEGPCTDIDVVKWIAQAYHLRAVDKAGDAAPDFKNAFEWYGRCLKCDPNDTDCKEGRDDTQFEF
jgi:tetratricopeptide (TPR) repeat protein